MHLGCSHCRTYSRSVTVTATPPRVAPKRGHVDGDMHAARISDQAVVPCRLPFVVRLPPLGRLVDGVQARLAVK